MLFLPGAVYLLLRLPGLGRAPIFNDEANYGLWVARMLASPSLETIMFPWHDDKIGCLPWAVALLDLAGWPAGWGPLLLWRWLSLFAGLITVILIMRLAWLLAGPDRHTLASLAAGLGWAVWPMAVIHERMAMFDGPLAAAWILAALAIETIRRTPTPSVRNAALAGVACALPISIKLTGLPALVIGAAVVIYHWKRGRMTRQAATAFFVAMEAVFLPILAFCFAHGTLISAQEHHAQSALPFVSNLAGLLGQLGAMLLISVFPPALAIMASGVFDKTHRLYVWLWAFLPIGIILLVGGYPGVYTRYYIPYMAPLWVAFGLGLATLSHWIARRIGSNPAVIGASLLFITLVLPAWQSALWLVAPECVLLTENDRFQYVTGWPSGRHIDSLRAVIEPMMARKPVKLASCCPTMNPYAGLHYIERHRPDRFQLVDNKNVGDAIRWMSETADETRLILDISPHTPPPLPPESTLLWQSTTHAPKFETQRLWYAPAK